MSLKHALLGFLSYAPLTGYELKRYFDDSVQHFWNANLSQIYPTLSKMKDDGLLTVALKYQEDAPNSKVYHLTEAGRAELSRWLQEPMELTPYREAFLIKVFFGSAMPKEDFLRLLEDKLREHKERLTVYHGIVFAADRRSDDPDAPCQEIRQLHKERVYWGFTLRAGILCEEAWIAWCEETIKTVQEMPE